MNRHVAYLLDKGGGVCFKLNGDAMNVAAILVKNCLKSKICGKKHCPIRKKVVNLHHEPCKH